VERWKNESGASIVQVMMAAGLLTALAAAGSSYISSLSKSSRKLESSLDLSSIKARMIESVSCTNTLASMANCPTTWDYVSLKDNAGRDITAADGSTQIGPFTVRARCNPGATGGIEVRAARLTPAGQASGKKAKNFQAKNSEWFVRDEVAANLSYNWEHPKGLLFAAAAPGVPADSRLCREFFVGPPSSADKRCLNPGEMMVGFNTMTQTPICEPVAPKVTTSTPCPPGTYMRGINNGDPDCEVLSASLSTSGACPPGHFMTAVVNGVPQCNIDQVGSSPSSPPAPGGMKWNSTGTLDGKLKKNSKSGNWFCDNKSHFYCADGPIAGVACSQKNAFCTHDPHKDSSHGCRVYKCY
jgi:hypothetical protein